MKIYAFVGASGTGKSYRAQWIAREKGISCIIDDGLLIEGNKILAGKSAKKEASKIASVRRAVFTEEAHATEVKEIIKKRQPESILILGTSDEMVKKIVSSLGLPEIEEFIRIEDVATEKEIEKAKYLRKELGKHVIPVPTVEIKSQFSGYFVNPLKIFKRKGKDDETVVSEKTIVRPAFSYMGEYTISERVVNSIVIKSCADIEGVRKITKVRNKNVYDGISIEVEFTGISGMNLMNVMRIMSEKIKVEVEKLTALNIIDLSITLKDIFYINNEDK